MVVIRCFVDGIRDMNRIFEMKCVLLAWITLPPLDRYLAYDEQTGLSPVE